MEVALTLYQCNSAITIAINHSFKPIVVSLGICIRSRLFLQNNFHSESVHLQHFGNLQPVRVGLGLGIEWCCVSFPRRLDQTNRDHSGVVLKRNLLHCIIPFEKHSELVLVLISAHVVHLDEQY